MILNDVNNYHFLLHSNEYYFSLPNDVTTAPGWYIILDGILPVYVGKSNNLNNRLNTQDGSRDNFANTKRATDTERNFIKKYIELNYILVPRVCFITAAYLEKKLNIPPLSKIDIDNVEKHINIWRGCFQYI